MNNVHAMKLSNSLCTWLSHLGFLTTSVLKAFLEDRKFFFLSYRSSFICLVFVIDQITLLVNKHLHLVDVVTWWSIGISSSHSFIHCMQGEEFSLQWKKNLSSNIKYTNFVTVIVIDFQQSSYDTCHRWDNFDIFSSQR